MMKKTILFLIIFSNLFFRIFASLSPIQQEFVEEHTPPQETLDILDIIFSDPKIIEVLARHLDPSFEISQEANLLTTQLTYDLEKFKIIKHKFAHGHFQIICEHKNLPGFILKIAPKPYYAKKSHARNISRVICAVSMREHIEQKNFKHIVIPKKYLFHIPGKEDDLNDDNYFVIAEKLDILSDQKSQTSLIQLCEEALDELKKIIINFGYKDFWFDNIRIAKHESKIAIIDTEQFKGFDVKKIDAWNSSWLNKIDGLIGRIKLKIYENQDTDPNKPVQQIKIQKPNLLQMFLRIWCPGFF